MRSEERDDAWQTVISLAPTEVQAESDLTGVFPVRKPLFVGPRLGYIDASEIRLED